MRDEQLEGLVRVAMFRFLDALVDANPTGAIRSSDLNGFVFEGRHVPLVVQTGIWKPGFLDAALTIRTTFTRPDAQPPYADSVAPDGQIRYKYRGIDPAHSDNRALRSAMERGIPLAYFVGVDRGIYCPRYPVWIVEEDPVELEFMVAVDEAQRFVDLDPSNDEQRSYISRLTRERLHQPVFRARVLHAYNHSCAICRLHHPELLDAAHILPDSHPRGDPIVPNGMAMCKLHHAAYDRNLIGIRPDLIVEVSETVLREHDGPMLLHGLQEMNGRRLEVPRQRQSKPDPERLEVRYGEFRQAS